MKARVVRILVALGCLVTSVSHATNQWSTQDYDLYAGDFNGDGKTDILYIAKSAANASGINLSDGTGPNVALQSWPSNYLGIPWYGNQFTVIVADFNGDGRSDILLQAKTPGDSYLLLNNGQGIFLGIAQTLPSTLASLGLSADQHRIIAGDFNHDGRADLFLQSTSPSGTNAVFLAESSGQFAASDLSQQWSDGYLGFNWATNEAIVYAGDFNGDGYCDLLVQARPRWAVINYDVPFPVPTYPPNMDGVVLANPSAPIFQASGIQSWSRNAFGADWSPLDSNIIIGDFSGGTKDADVILQGKTSGKASDLLIGNASGTIFSAAAPLSSNVTWTADSYQLIAADFSGSGTAGVYLQALTPSGTNYYATGITSSSASVTQQTPVVATELMTYTYDALGRLKVVTRSGSTVNGQTQYNLDPSGNRTSVTSTVTQ